jgi:flagellar secretion chaperone FliS
LQALYEYMDRRLMDSNLRKEPDGLNEARRHLTTLRDAWAEMLQTPRAPVGLAPALQLA